MMKYLSTRLLLFTGCLLIAPIADAKQPSSDSSPGRNSIGKVKVRPQLGANRLTGQATPQASSPTPGRGKAMSRVAPLQRLARRQNGHQGKKVDVAETTHDGAQMGHHGLKQDAPRIAMTRSLGKRLSQIDKIRDKALETGDLGLLELADQLELRARRKFDEMTARMDQRRELGKPGVGPPVLMPVVEPTPEPVPPESQEGSEPTVPSETEVPLDQDVPETTSTESEAAAEQEPEAETDSNQQS